MSGLTEPVGGYFGLELPGPNPWLPPGGMAFQSARAAFTALLRAVNPRRVWMPRFICDTMLEPVRRQAIPCEFYNLDHRMGIEGSLTVGPGELLLYVNYFGVCDARVAEVLARYDASRVVIDNSQAWFSPPADALATLYSPRKFFGVPDGGVLVSQVSVLAPSRRDEDSEGRMTHLLRRLSHGPEAGYEAYRLAEASLHDCEPLAMSALTRALMASLDFERVRTARCRNFRLLHDILGPVNPFPLEAETVDAPMCYPWLQDDEHIRGRLAVRRIYLATYWPEVAGRAGPDSWEETLMRFCLPVPCDQRYEVGTMRCLGATLKNREI